MTKRLLIALTWLLAACAGGPSPASTPSAPVDSVAENTPSTPTPTLSTQDSVATRAAEIKAATATAAADAEESIPVPNVVNRTTSGEVPEDELWSGEIHLTGDIILAPGVTLVIAPGTTVWLASNSDDTHCCEGDFVDDYTIENNDPTRFATWNQSAININGIGGTIYAVGTAEEPIFFRPEGDSTSPAQWDGVVIERGSIQHAILLYGGHTVIQPYGYLSNTIEIAYNQVRGFLWAGIDAHRDYVWIHHNIVEGGGHQGIAVRGRSVAEFNVVINSQSCMSIESGEESIIRNNLLLDCGRGFDARAGNNYQILNNVIGWLDGPTGWFYQGNLIYPPFEGTGYFGGVIGENVQIQNNIVFNMAYGFHLKDTPEGDFQLDHNLLYTNQWITGERAEAAGENLLGSDPLFANWAGLDLILGAGSPAIDAGVERLLDPDGSPSDLGIFGGPEAEGWGAFDFGEVLSPSWE